MALTVVDQGLLGTYAQYTGFKNRIINGAMVIDQRNSGASVSIATTSDVYTLDRWAAAGQSADGVFTVQQDTTVPTGYKNSMKITVTTADSSIGASQYYLMQQNIEGLNLPDLNWGTANAQTVTLSFWVRSSVTGTFGGSLRGSFTTSTRSYPFSYTINSANTFEYKTITILGDTSGTWATDNSAGIRLTFSMGDGSSRLGTSGTWATANYTGVTGQTNLIATNSATWYVTGIQVEKGSTATSFDYRPYGTELQLCQRYYEIIAPVQSSFLISVNATAGSQEFEFLVKYLVLKRATPTVTRIGTWADSNCSGVTPVVVGTDLFSLALFSNASGRCYTYNNGSSNASFTVSSEL
jgi:hypothetical protein